MKLEVCYYSRDRWCLFCFFKGKRRQRQEVGQGTSLSNKNDKEESAHEFFIGLVMPHFPANSSSSCVRRKLLCTIITVTVFSVPPPVFASFCSSPRERIVSSRQIVLTIPSSNVYVAPVSSFSTRKQHNATKKDFNSYGESIQAVFFLTGPLCKLKI